MNPEFRQRLNTISRGLESANEVAQENIYTFTQLYIDPCVSGFKACIYDCTGPCFPNREDRLRRSRGRSRGRIEYDFDFYGDWEDDELGGYVAPSWGNDELDSLLAGRGSRSPGQPRRQRGMSYGARGRSKLHGQTEEDPTVIPGSAYLGFLERLPFKLGSRVLRYKPSAAGLQENPGGLRISDVEAEPLFETEEEDAMDQRTSDGHKKGHLRQRSDTVTSRSTTNSLSSRGDLIMGDEEDDAVPIDDEFTLTLSRRTTETDYGKRPQASRFSTRTMSNKSFKSGKSGRSHRSSSRKESAALSPSPVLENTESTTPTMNEFKREEQKVEEEEETEIRLKREAATKLAEYRGLSADSKSSSIASLEAKLLEGHTPMNRRSAFQDTLEQPTQTYSPDAQFMQQLPPTSPISSYMGHGTDSETEPFPSMPTTPSKDHREYVKPP